MFAGQDRDIGPCRRPAAKPAKRLENRAFWGLWGGGIGQPQPFKQCPQGWEHLGSLVLDVSVSEKSLPLAQTYHHGNFRRSERCPQLAMTNDILRV